MSENNIRLVMRIAEIGYRGALKRYSLFAAGGLSVEGLFSISKRSPNNPKKLMINAIASVAGVSHTCAVERYNCYLKGEVSIGRLFLPVGKYVAARSNRLVLLKSNYSKQPRYLIGNDLVGVRKEPHRFVVKPSHLPLWPVVTKDKLKSTGAF